MADVTKTSNSQKNIPGILQDLIDRVRIQYKYDQITVVTTTRQSQVYIRRCLAKNGLFNINFLRLEDIPELIIDNDVKTPVLNQLQASEYVYESALKKGLGARLGGNKVSIRLQEALHKTFRDLELLNDKQLKQIKSENDTFKELINRFNSYKNSVSSYRLTATVAHKVARMIIQDPERTSIFGTIILLETPNIDHAQRSLFQAIKSIPKTMTVSCIESDVDFISKSKPNRFNHISVPDVTEEVKTVIREISRLAKTGKRFATMGILYEDNTYADRLSESLEMSGIPISGPGPTVLKNTPVGRFIIGVLDIFENGFRRDDVSAWFASSPIKNPTTQREIPAAKWDAISRNSGVTHSVQYSWIPKLDQYANNIVNKTRRSQRIEESLVNEITIAESDALMARDLKDFIFNLSKRDPLNERKNWSEFGSWARKILKDYFIFNNLGATENQENDLFKSLDELLKRIAELKPTDSKVEFEHFSAVIRDQLSRTSYNFRKLGNGVYLGPLRTAVGCSFETIFIVGMSEDNYPYIPVPDPLLPDYIKKILDPDQLSLKTVQKLIEENYRIFLSILNQSGQVFLYWPRVSPGESRQLSPSRWFMDVLRKISGTPHLQTGTLLRQPVPELTVVKHTDRDLLPEKSGSEYEYDLILSKAWRLTGKHVNEFPLISEKLIVNNSIRFIFAKAGNKWTEYDGNIKQKQSSFRSDQYVGSATSFEMYAACPYRYFLSQRLRVEPTKSPYIRHTLDPLEFGTLIHDILEQFSLRRLRRKNKNPTIDKQIKYMTQEVDSSISKLKEQTPGLSEGAWKIERSRILHVLHRWLRNESSTARYPEMRQIEAEYSFGNDNQPSVNIQTLSGQSIRFKGQVDRIDISKDGKKVIVYDYKSGSSFNYRKLTSDPVSRGKRLQLPIYARAIARKYIDANVTAAYWFIDPTDPSELKPGPGNYLQDETDSSMQNAVEIIADGMDKGNYPARPGDSINHRTPSFENCRLCEYRRICPESKARLWNLKKFSDDSLRRYVDLSEGGPNE